MSVCLSGKKFNILECLCESRCLSVCLSSTTVFVVPLNCMSVCLEKKFNILECLCAEPLKKTMVITADDGSAYVIGSTSQCDGREGVVVGPTIIIINY